MAMTKDEMSSKLRGKLKVFDERMNHRMDELKWLYIELYHNDWMYAELIGQMELFYGDRSDDLKKTDGER